MEALQQIKQIPLTIPSDIEKIYNFLVFAGFQTSDLKYITLDDILDRFSDFKEFEKQRLSWLRLAVHGSNKEWERFIKHA